MKKTAKFLAVLLAILMMASTFTAFAQTDVSGEKYNYHSDLKFASYGGAKVKISSKNGSFDAPIVGRICMDQCMVDITDGVEFLPETGDEVTLLGDSCQRLYDLAKIANTIPYEILCAVSSRVIRLYI